MPMLIYWLFKGPAAIECAQLSNDSRQTQEYKCVDDIIFIQDVKISMMMIQNVNFFSTLFEQMLRLQTKTK